MRVLLRLFCLIAAVIISFGQLCQGQCEQAFLTPLSYDILPPKLIEHADCTSCILSLGSQLTEDIRSKYDINVYFPFQFCVSSESPFDSLQCEHFACSLDKTCLKPSQMCDGVQDCSSGEDEVGCSQAASACSISGEQSAVYRSWEEHDCESFSWNAPAGYDTLIWLTCEESEQDRCPTVFDGESIASPPAREATERESTFHKTYRASERAYVRIPPEWRGTMSFRALPREGQMRRAFVLGSERVVTPYTFEERSDCGSFTDPCPSLSAALLARCPRWSGWSHPARGSLLFDPAVALIDAADLANRLPLAPNLHQNEYLTCDNVEILILSGRTYEHRLPNIHIMESTLSVVGVAGPQFSILDSQSLGIVFVLFDTSIVLLEGLLFRGAKAALQRSRGNYNFRGGIELNVFPLALDALINAVESSLHIRTCIFEILDLLNAGIMFSNENGCYVAARLCPEGGSLPQNMILPQDMVLSHSVVLMSPPQSSNTALSALSLSSNLASRKLGAFLRLASESLVRVEQQLFNVTITEVVAAGTHEAFANFLRHDDPIYTNSQSYSIPAALTVNQLTILNSVLETVFLLLAPIESVSLHAIHCKHVSAESLVLADLTATIASAAKISICNAPGLASKFEISASDFHLEHLDVIRGIFDLRGSCASDDLKDDSVEVNNITAHHFSGPFFLLEAHQIAKIANVACRHCSTSATSPLIHLKGSSEMSIESLHLSDSTELALVRAEKQSNINVSAASISFTQNEDISLIEISDAADANLVSVDVTDYQTSSSSALSVAGGRLYMRDCSFSSFEGVRASPLLIAIDSDVIIEDTSIGFIQGVVSAIHVERGTVHLSGVHASGNKVDREGALFSLDNAFLHCDNCRFDNNSAHTGGVVISRGTTRIELMGTSFHGNTAVDGAAMFFPSNATTLTLTNVSFTANVATGGGGIVYFDSWDEAAANDLLSQFHTQSIDANVAAYGPLAAGPPVTMRFDESLKYEQAASAVFDPPLAVVLRDFLNQDVSSPTFTSEVRVLALHHNTSIDDETRFLGIAPIASARDRGRAVLEKAKIVAVPGSRFDLEATAIAGNTHFSTATSIYLRPCLDGEILTECDDSLTVCQGCQKCEDGFYSLKFKPIDAEPVDDPYDTFVCRECPPGATCHGNAINAKDNFWHLTPTSSLMKKCADDSPCEWSEDDLGRQSLTCLSKGRNVTVEVDGRVVTDNPLCSVCEEGYGTDGRFCGECRGDSDYALIALLFVAINAVVLYFSEKYKLFTSERIDRGIIMKVSMSYLHSLVAASRLKDRFEGVLFEWLDVETKAGQSVSGFTELPIVDCAFKAGGVGYHGQAYFNFCLPFILSIYFAILVSGIVFVKQRNNAKNKWQTLAYNAVIRTVVLVFNLLYPWISEKTFSTITSTRLDRVDTFSSNGEWDGEPAYPELQGNALRASNDLTIDYRSEAHQIAVVVAVLYLVFIVLGLPVGLLYLLRRNRHKLNDDLFRAQLGFVFLGYRETYYFWEIVIVARKALLSLIVVSLSIDDTYREYQVGFSALVAILAFSAHTFTMPFKKASHNILELLSLASLCAIMFASIMYLRDNILGLPGLEALTAAIVLSVNLFFICSAVYALSVAYIRMALQTKIAKKLFRF